MFNVYKKEDKNTIITQICGMRMKLVKCWVFPWLDSKLSLFFQHIAQNINTRLCIHQVTTQGGLPVIMVNFCFLVHNFTCLVQYINTCRSCRFVLLSITKNAQNININMMNKHFFNISTPHSNNLKQQFLKLQLEHIF